MNSTLHVVKEITKRSFNTLGIEVRRKRSPVHKEYYPSVDSCQIANLSYIYELFLGRRANGRFVEVGAFDGYTYSNSWGLAERGWHGLLVEPVPQLADMARRRHQEHGSVQVIERAAGATESTLTLNLGGPFTTANPRHAEVYNSTDWVADYMTGDSIEVRQSTLDTILGEQGMVDDFDVLVVDVEGFESEVFAGFSLERWLPKILIVELEIVHGVFTTSRRSHFELGRKIEMCGYDVVFKDTVNTIFVRSDIAEQTLLQGQD